MRSFSALTKAQFKGFFRDGQTMFWTVLFPLLFLVTFGIMFNDAGQSKSKIAVVGQAALIDAMPADGKAAWDQLFETSRTDNRQEALDKVRKGELAGAVEVQGNHVVLHYSQADKVKAAVVQGTLDSFVQAANQALTGTPPVLTFEAQQVEDKSLRPIQFLTPGLLGWAIAMGAMFGAAMVLVQWRQTKLLRRLRLSPVSTLSVVGSRTLIAMAVAMVQMAIFLGVGIGAFGLKLTDSWWAAIPLVLCGTLSFMAIGLIVGSVSKTPEGASGLANTIVMPMAFLSGSFIPMDSVPSWVQTISKFLPLGHLNEGMLNVMVRGQPASAAVVPALVLLGFAVVAAVIAARLFRWEK